ncbi:substrate-binding domain-containing protein [Frankia sp. Cppng1_Ct_nod]|uniref:sugar ABC transporter substrate-binding protein n=1 Tax=Frankia sp. Cppng1_Ct_nod TaxID=2897162 RepID=UPI001040F3EC|nr:substrate-binding domain-containing protein [Frankia sp. Cppng1_Ct_nod]
MRTTPRRTVVVAAVAATTALFAAACGSSGSTPKSGASAAVQDTGSAGLVQAKAAVDASLKNPSGIVLDTPLSKTPPTGKYVITVETPVPVTKVRDDALVEAAKVLGWRYERIVPGSGPEDYANAVTQAISKHPDAIHISGTPLALLKSQLDQAKAQNIPVISDSVGGAADTAVFSNSLDGDEQVATWGKMVANYVAVNSNGKANVALFTIKAFPILGVFVDNFKSTLSSVCPSCTVKEVNQQLADLGTKTPSSVVSTVQQDPKINWAIFSFGDLTLGVDAALKGAGLNGKVNIGGETPSQANLTALKDGTENVWTGFSASILGWRVADLLARQFNGDDLAPASKALLPTQLITKDNLSSVSLDSTGYYVGFAGYQDAFKKLWQIQ